MCFVLVICKLEWHDLPDIASFRATSTERQPGRDAKVLSGNQTGMWERD
jgi:hypothetical protein